MWLDWQPAIAIAAALGAVAFAMRRSGRSVLVTASPAANETSLVFALYGLWAVAGQLSIMRLTEAVSRGRWLWHTEQTLHIGTELAIQRAVIDHPLWIQAMNRYYATLHGPALIVLLVWLFLRHRDAYPAIRNTIVLLTGICLAVQLIPVAPPRLVPGLGFVDTALRYHQSVYRQFGAPGPDQLSAMPSVHVGWAVLIGWAVVKTSPSRHRWWVLVHPTVTAIVVVATANHWWADGIVAVAILVLSIGIRWVGRWIAERARLLLAAFGDRPGDVSIAPALLADVDVGAS